MVLVSENSTSSADTDVVLVSGANGFIGQHLCALLIQKGVHVRALVRSEAAKETLNGLGVENVVVASLQNLDALAECCVGVTTVFHLAGLAHAGTTDSENLRAVNVVGTKNIATVAKTAGVSKFVFFSSILATNCEPGNSTLESPYAWSKKQAEEALLELSDASFSAGILRPVNVYGAGMKGNIAGLIRRIRAGKLPPLPRLENSFPMVSVEDLVEAALLVVSSAKSEGQIYPICDGQSYTPNSIEFAIYAALSRKKPAWHSPRVVFYAASLGAQLANTLGIWKNDLGLRTYRNMTSAGMNPPVSSEKITVELGFQPQRTFASELPAILETI